MTAAMAIDGAGLWSEASYVPSPNCDDRPTGGVIDMVVVHAISLPPGEFGGDNIERLFTNRLDPDAHPYFATIADLRVSAHFLIRRDGTAVQFVPVTARAWHAGISVWRGRERCNDFSIGIELEGCDEKPFDPAQYRQLAALIRVIKRHYPITEIVGHSDIAPDRKTDPGPLFDWPRLRALLA
jgi:AmpD protein